MAAEGAFKPAGHLQEGVQVPATGMACAGRPVADMGRTPVMPLQEGQQHEREEVVPQVVHSQLVLVPLPGAHLGAGHHSLQQQAQPVELKGWLPGMQAVRRAVCALRLQGCRDSCWEYPCRVHISGQAIAPCSRRCSLFSWVISYLECAECADKERPSAPCSSKAAVPGAAGSAPFHIKQTTTPCSGRR